MRVLRKIKGFSSRYRLRNINIRRELDVTNIIEKIERDRLILYGHIQGMRNRR